MARIPFKDKLTLGNMQSELGGLLERLWHCGLNTGPLDGQDFAPPIELREEPDRFVVVVELPGVDRATIDVTANANSVTISGEKPAPSGDEACGSSEACDIRTIQTERRYGVFRRTITLPGLIRPEAAMASLDDGLLELVLPKSPEAMAKTVTVELRSPIETT